MIICVRQSSTASHHLATGGGGGTKQHLLHRSSVPREGGRGLTEELQGQSHPCSIGLPKIARFNAVGSAADKLNPLPQASSRQ